MHFIDETNFIIIATAADIQGTVRKLLRVPRVIVMTRNFSISVPDIYNGVTLEIIKGQPFPAEGEFLTKNLHPARHVNTISSYQGREAREHVCLFSPSLTILPV